jgi:uncharacterized protein (TIGR02246 family)
MDVVVGKTGRARNDRFNYRNASRRAASVALMLIVMIEPAAAAGEDEVRATFDRFVTAQNAHDAETVSSLLLSSPQFLWVTRGTAVWGTDAALERFAALYEGAWHLEPEASEIKVMMIAEGAAQIFAPIDFTIGAQGDQPQPMRFLMNMVLTETPEGWKISSILPIPAPKQ